VFSLVPCQVQLILQHLDGLPDGLDLGDEAFHGYISTQLHMRPGLTVLQTGLGKLNNR